MFLFLPQHFEQFVENGSVPLLNVLQFRNHFRLTLYVTLHRASQS